MNEEMNELREAARDLGFLVFRSLGIIALVRKLGMTPKDWILEREQRGVLR